MVQRVGAVKWRVISLVGQASDCDHGHLVFFRVDDTMLSTFDTKFENVSKLFVHATHNGSNYLNGHCFVIIMLCIPVWN